MVQAEVLAMAAQLIFSPVQDIVKISRFTAKVHKKATPHDMDFVISAACLKHLDPGIIRGLGNIGNFDKERFTVRLDRQANSTKGAANLQIQVNDSALAQVHLNHQIEGTTIAQVLVPFEVYRAAVPGDISLGNQLQGAVRKALRDSFNSNGYQFVVKVA